MSGLRHLNSGMGEMKQYAYVKGTFTRFYYSDRYSDAQIQDILGTNKDIVRVQVDNTRPFAVKRRDISPKSSVFKPKVKTTWPVDEDSYW